MRPLKIRKRTHHGKPVLCVDTRYVLKEGGKRHFFHPDDRETAEKFLATIKGQIEDEPIILTGAKKRAWQMIEDYGVPEFELLACHRKHNKPIDAKLFTDALGLFIQAKRRSGKSSEYVRIIENRLQSFENSAGKKPVSEYTPAEIQEYLNTREWGSYTRNRVVIDLKTFFNFCRLHGWCVSNPVSKIEKIEIHEFEKGILTVPQCQIFMQTVLKVDRQLTRYFADQLFGFMREDEARRLREDQVKETYVEFTTGQAGERATKTGAIRFVEINDTWRAWRFGEYGPFKNFARRVFKVKKLAKEEMVKQKLVSPDWWFPRNCLRHSACTYGAKMFGASKAADLAGHSEAIQKKNYRRPVTLEDAKAFWSIRPAELSRIP